MAGLAGDLTLSRMTRNEPPGREKRQPFQALQCDPVHSAHRLDVANLYIGRPRCEGGKSLFAICLLLIAGLALCLGFFALLRQHTYLDPKTNAPIEIELPLLGRMKANYPALIFPFIAALFGYLGYMSQEMQPTTWSVT